MSPRSITDLRVDCFILSIRTLLNDSKEKYKIKQLNVRILATLVRPSILYKTMMKVSGLYFGFG
jgi:hypothetical protein